VSQGGDGRFAVDPDVYPVADGATLSFTVTRDLAAALDRYQCGEHPSMGGEVRIAGRDAASAGVRFPEQSSGATSVVVDSVRLADGGFVAVYDGTAAVAPRNVRGVSPYLDAGVHRTVVIEFDDPLFEPPDTMVAVPHRDTTGTETFAFVETDGRADRPYVDRAGDPASDTAQLTIRRIDQPAEIRVVEPAEAAVRVGETVTVRVEVENAGDQPQRFEVCLTVGGWTEATKAVDLRSGDRETVSFEIETVDRDPGEYDLRVVTSSDEYTDTLRIETDTPDASPTKESGGTDAGDGPAPGEEQTREPDVGDSTDDTADDEGGGFGVFTGAVGLAAAVVYRLRGQNPE